MTFSRVHLAEHLSVLLHQVGHSVRRVHVGAEVREQLDVLVDFLQDEAHHAEGGELHRRVGKLSKKGDK